jgi:hypothetical protein
MPGRWSCWGTTGRSRSRANDVAVQAPGPNAFLRKHRIRARSANKCIPPQAPNTSPKRRWSGRHHSSRGTTATVPKIPGSQVRPPGTARLTSFVDDSRWVLFRSGTPFRPAGGTRGSSRGNCPIGGASGDPLIAGPQCGSPPAPGCYSRGRPGPSGTRSRLDAKNYSHLF